MKPVPLHLTPKHLHKHVVYSPEIIHDETLPLDS